MRGPDERPARRAGSAAGPGRASPGGPAALGNWDTRARPGGRRGPAGPCASRERRAKSSGSRSRSSHRTDAPLPGPAGVGDSAPRPPGPRRPRGPAPPPGRLPQARSGGRSLTRGGVSGLDAKEGVSRCAGSARFSNLRGDAFPGAGSESPGRGGKSLAAAVRSGQRERGRAGENSGRRLWCFGQGLDSSPGSPSWGTAAAGGDPPAHPFLLNFDERRVQLPT